MGEPRFKPVNAGALCRVDTYSDGENADIVMFTPVLPSGLVDETRAPKFISSMNIVTQGKTAKVNFEISAAMLAEAIENYVPAAEAFAREAVAHLESEALRARLMGGEPASARSS